MLYTVVIVVKLIIVNLALCKTLWTENLFQSEVGTSSEISVNEDVLQLLNTIVDAIAQAGNQSIEPNYMANNPTNTIFDERELPEPTRIGGGMVRNDFNNREIPNGNLVPPFDNNGKIIQSVNDENARRILLQRDEQGTDTLPGNFGKEIIPRIEDLGGVPKSEIPHGQNGELLDDRVRNGLLVRPTSDGGNVESAEVRRRIGELKRAGTVDPMDLLTEESAQQVYNIIREVLANTSKEQATREKFREENIRGPINIPGVGQVHPTSVQVFTIRPGENIDLNQLKRLLNQSTQSKAQSRTRPPDRDYWRRWRANMLINRPAELQEDAKLNQTLSNFINDLKSYKLGVYNFV